MSEQPAESWLLSGQYARVNGLRLKPLEHSQLKGTLLQIQRGQAAAILLRAENGAWWILKKFRGERALDRTYLRAVRSCLPAHPGFRSGIEREVLEARQHAREPGRYYSAELARWLDGTVLMPRVAGTDWAGLADDLREGALQLDRTQRVCLCRGLVAGATRATVLSWRNRPVVRFTVETDRSEKAETLIRWP